MKRLLCLLALCAGTLHAQLITLSDFSNFTPGYYSQPFPADNTSWSELTSQSGPTSFSIGDFGSGAAGGAIGNGFIEFLPTESDWSAYTSVTLQGVGSLFNQTPTLFFYVESVVMVDGADEITTALTAFDLTDFDAQIGLLSVVAPLNFEGIDPTRVTAWGFVVQEFDNPAFSFTFDNVGLTAIPEPSTYAMISGALALAAAVGRRMRTSRRKHL